MTTVARCIDIQEANRVKMALEANGLKVFLPDEYSAQISPPRFFTSTGGVRVQVADEDAQAAKDILKDQAK